MENRIQVLRKKKGLSQKQLAELVGTSQQQIQRIEVGKQVVNFYLAMRVCKALEVPMQVVFPQTKEAITLSQKKGETPTEMLDEVAFRERIEKAGLYLESDLWVFRFRLRGGLEREWPLSGPEKNRLWYAVQRAGDNPFTVFESEDVQVILNLNHLIYCHFLYAAAFESPSEGTGESTVSVYLAASSEPLYFDVEPDDPAPENWEEDEGQFRYLVSQAELILEDDTKEVFHFMDDEGEMAFFRAQDIAMITIPLPIVESELLNDEDEEAEENG